jgi:RNA polymerase sigma-70 factor, ECF subfamily
MLGTGAATEDVVQETFVRLWRSGPNPAESPPGLVMSWLYRTSTRLAIDTIRERRHLADEGPEDLTLPCGAPRADAILAARARIRALAATIPEDELEAALLARVDGLSQPEVANVLGVSERTVRRLLERFDERTTAHREERLS